MLKAATIRKDCYGSVNTRAGVAQCGCPHTSMSPATQTVLTRVLAGIEGIVYNRRFVRVSAESCWTKHSFGTVKPLGTVKPQSSRAIGCIPYRVLAGGGSLLNLTVVQPVCVLYTERADLCGAVPAAGADLPDGGAASVSLLDQPEVRDPRGAHDFAGATLRPAGPARAGEELEYKLPARAEDAWSGAGACVCVRPVRAGADVVLASQGLEHVMKAPLAQHLGVKRVVANRLEFRDGVATGRLLEPVIRPRGAFARIREQSPDGRRAPDDAGAATGYYGGGTAGGGDWVGAGIGGAGTSDCALLEGQTAGGGIFGAASFGREALMLIGVDWIYWQGLAGEHADGVAEDRENLSADSGAEVESAQRRFEKIVEESPVFWIRSF